MSLFEERLLMADRISARRHNHQRRSELIRELRDLTTKQIQQEIRWGWLRKYKPSERTLTLIGIAIGSALYVGGMVMHVWTGMSR